MNDERDHDTEHIEKGAITDKIKSVVSGASGAKKKGEDGIANAGSAHKDNKDIADGEAGKPETIKPIPAEGGGPSQQDRDDYHEYKGLFNDKRGFADKGSRNRGIHPMGQMGPHGREKWRDEYDDLKSRRDSFEQTDSEYKAHTGRSLADEGIKDWGSYTSLFGGLNGPFRRGADGSAPDYDQVSRGRARSAAYRAGGKRYDDEGDLLRDRGGAFIDPMGKAGFYTEDDADFARKLGVTDEGLQAMYQEFEEKGTISPETAEKYRVKPEEIQVVEEQAEKHDEEATVVPMSSETGTDTETETGTETGAETETSEKKIIPTHSAQANTSSNSKVVTGDKPSITSQRMMDAGLAGLNMFGGIMGGANKAFSMLRGLASALTSRQLMSDPTLPARGFLNAMEQSGQIVEDHIRQVGEAYGIKDGVKRDDLVGTYKGAQYYREKQQIENAEKQYYAGVGNALSTVLGNNVDVNDTVGIQNALAQMTPQQLSQLDDALFGRNGSLKDMYEATVVNPMGSTREQKARAQLLTTLNQSLKGQAQANAREAGRQRTQANQQIQQYNQENRRIKAGQEQQIAMAEQMLRDPTTMANISDDAQMEAFVNAVLGRKINNKQIPINRNGEVEIGTLKEEDLRSLMNRLQQPEFQNLSGAMTLKKEVNDRLEAIKQNKAQTTAQNQANAIAPIANSPLDLDISVDRKNLDRDRFGIPHDRGARSRLRDKAKDMIGKIRSTTNSPDDIALCENVITMCDMADARENLSKYAGDLVKKGIISNIDRDIAIQNADKVYELMANSLATTVAERTNRVNSGQDWKETAATRAIDMRMKGTENFLRMKHKQFLDDKQAAKDQAAQNKADAEKAKADAKVAEYEKAANRDGRGISLAPWTPGSNRYRNDDLKNANTELAQIEKELASLPVGNVNSARERMKLNMKRADVQSKIRQIHQENHIQKLIYDAGSLPDGEANDVRQKAEALRGQYSDWKEFGKAINDIRKEAGLKKSTAWSSSERAEREQQAHSENQALINAVKNLTDAVKGQPDAMKNMINDFLADKDGKFEGKVLDILEKSYGNLTDQLLGDNSKLPGLVEKAMRNAFDNHIRDEAGKMIGASVSNAIEPTRRLAEGIRDISRSIRNEIQRGKLKDNLDKMLLNVTSMGSMLSQALIDTAEKKVVNLANMKKSIDTQVEANTNAIKGLVSSLSAAGSGKPEFALSEEDKTRMEQLKDALSTQNTKLTDLIDRMDKGGVVTRQDILDILGTLNDADRNPDATNLDELESSDWEARGYSVDDINELMDNYAYLINMSAEFARGLEAQDQQGAFPVRLTDDAMETLANMISRKIIEAGGLDAWKAQNTATATVQPEQGEFQNPARDVRDDASEAGQETVSEATGPEVEEQVDQPVEEPQTDTEEAKEGEIYGEGKYGEAILTPEEKQELNETEQTEEKPISEMTHEELDQYLEDRYSELVAQNEGLTEKMRELRAVNPLLFRHVMDNPDELLDMYVAEASMNDEGGPTLHQSYKNLLQNAQVYRAFGDDDATNERVVEQMVNDMLGAPDREDAEKTRLKWLGDNPSIARAATVNNASTMANRFLDKVFTANAKRKHDAELADATQKGLNAEAIRDYFKYLHKEAKPTQAELRAARTEARKQQQQQDRDRANQEAWEKQREPTAQALGMDLSTQEGKQAYDAVYRGIIQRNAPVLYDGDRMDATVRNTYIPVLKELREQNTPESKQMFDKIMDSLMPALFQQTSINGGDNTKEASLGFDRNAAVKGLQLAREGKLGNRNAELFSPENLFDIWAEGRNTHIGNQGRSIIQEAYQLGKAEVAREKKIDAFYNPVMSGKVFGGHIEGIQGQMEKLNRIEPWSKIKTANAGKPQETRRDEYEKIKSNLEKEVKIAEDHLKALNDIYGRVGTGYYKDSEARQVEIPPEKVEEIENEIKAKLGDIRDWEKVVREKKKDIRTLNTSIKNITNDMIKKQKEAEEKAKAAARAEAAKKKEEAKVEQPAQPTETPIEQPAQPTETPVEIPKEPEKQDYYTEEKSPQALIDEMGEWLGEDDVHSVQEMLPDNATQEQWLAAGLKAIAGKSRDPVSTLRNWAEAMGMNPDEVVYHPKNTSTIDEIAKRIVDFRRGVTEPKQPVEPVEERAEQPAQPAGYKMNGYDPKGFASNVNKWVRTSEVADKIKNAQKVFADKWRQDHKNDPNSSFREAPQEELTTIALQEILKSVDNPEEVLKSWGEAFGADTSDWKVDRDTINGIAGMLVNGSPDLDDLHRTPDGQIDWAGVETGATMLPGRWNREIYDDIVAKKIGKLTGGNPKKVMYDYLDKLNSLSSGYKFKSPEEIAYAFTRGDGVKIPEQEAAKAEIRDKINKMYPDMTYRNFRAGLKTVGPFIPRLKEMGLWNDTPIEEENDDMDISEEESKQYQSYFN